MQLTVFAHFESQHHAQAWCLETLTRLAAQAQGPGLQIYAIYNGFPLNYDQALAPLAGDYASLYLPVAVSRRTLLSELLTRDWQGEFCLWLDGRSLWNPPALANWQAHLSSHPEHQGVMPAPASAPDDVDGAPSMREAQALAQNPPVTGADFASRQVTALPACFGWLRKSSESLRSRLETAAPLSLGQDRATLIWAPQASGPESDLTPEDSRRLWQALRQGEKQRLAEALRRSPASPALYQQALRLEPELAQQWLEQAFVHGVVSPQLLIQAQQHYRQAASPAAAEACEQLFQALYGQDPPTGVDRGSLSALLEPYPALPRPASLSVCLIVKDEIDTLARCLTSVSGLAAEIIVVDTGSGDGTPELATRLGARVIHWAWRNDFAAARNVSLAHATGDWILVLDADQALDPRARAVLWRFLWDPPPGLPRCQVQILNHDEQGHPGLTNYTSQLFPRHPRLRYRHRIHESIVYSGAGHSPAPLLKGLLLQHSGYRRDVYEQKQKGPRNLGLLLQQQAEEPGQPVWMYYLGDSYLSVGQPAEAIAWFERALQGWDELAARQTAFPQHIRDDAAVRLLQAHLRLGHFDQILALAHNLPRGIEEIPDYWYFLGQAHLGMNQEAEAESAFRRCLGFRGREAELMCYFADYIERAPLLELVQIGRNRLLAGQASESSPVQPSRLAQLRADLIQLLGFYPEGDWRADGFNLYHLLAQLCLAQALRDQELPLTWLEPYQQRLQARLAGQALRWFTDQSPGNAALEGFALSAAELAQLQDSQAFRRQLCQELWHQGQAGRGLAEALFALTSLRSPDAEAVMLHAFLCHQSHDPLRALAVIRDGLRRFPTHPVLLNNAAMLLFETGKPQAALTELEVCLQAHPGFLEARDNLNRIQAWLASQGVPGS